MVGLDLSEYTDMVLEHALDQAARHERPELHLLTVREKKRPALDEVEQALWTRVQGTLEEFSRHAQEWRARLHVRSGKPDEEIVQLAAELAADLIVIGEFGLHHPRPSNKALPNLVILHAPCPTLVVGLPRSYDAQQCPMCVAIRDRSEGELWWCDDHASERRDHVRSPMTRWSAGTFEIDRAA